jgi:predicted TIM-barrel fold metal-dependent hydrolase
MTDPAGIAAFDRIGPDLLLWASDYPHDDSTWPHSQQVIAEHFKDLPPADREKVVFSNAAALYNMQV